VTLIVLGTLIGADIRASASMPGGGGFFAPWQAARAFIYQNTSPYGAEVRAAAEQLAYRRPAQAGERPYFVTTPFFILLAYFPIALFSNPAPGNEIWAPVLSALADPATARGLWLFISQAALVGTALLALRLIEWSPGRLFQIAFPLVMVFSLYSVISLLEGSPAILLGLIYIAALYAYATGQDELAGGLLALALFSWETGLFFVVLMLWKAFYDKRWRVWAGLGMALAVLLIVSFILYPGWVLPFASSSLASWRALFGTTSAVILQRLSPAYGERAGQAVSVVVALLLLYEWAAARRGDMRRFAWTACLTLAVTPLIGLRIELGNLVVILPGLALIFAGIANRWPTGNWLVGLLLLVVLLLPWGWFVRATLLEDAAAADNILLFLPLFAAFGLYWTRWWFVRPPRTWLEHARSNLHTA
jgi:hypothetical protein